MMSRGNGGTPRQEPKRKTGGKKKSGGAGAPAGRLQDQPRQFRRSARAIVRRRQRPAPVPAPQRSTRAGPSSRGELYEYYKRAGKLDIFFALFPG